MLKDRSLVEFVCETPLWANGRRAFKTATSFYAAVMLQYLATVPVITDEVLTVVLPHVFAGLKARQSLELQVRRNLALLVNRQERNIEKLAKHPISQLLLDCHLHDPGSNLRARHFDRRHS